MILTNSFSPFGWILKIGAKSCQLRLTSEVKTGISLKITEAFSIITIHLFMIWRNKARFCKSGNSCVRFREELFLLCVWLWHIDWVWCWCPLSSSRESSYHHGCQPLLLLRPSPQTRRVPCLCTYTVPLLLVIFNMFNYSFILTNNWLTHAVTELHMYMLWPEWCWLMMCSGGCRILVRG
jgi:hypothetical protein